MMVWSGVRSSWLMLARNSLLSRLARSSSRLVSLQLGVGFGKPLGVLFLHAAQAVLGDPALGGVANDRGDAKAFRGSRRD